MLLLAYAESFSSHCCHDLLMHITPLDRLQLAFGKKHEAVFGRQLCCDNGMAQVLLPSTTMARIPAHTLCLKKLSQTECPFCAACWRPADSKAFEGH